MARSVADDSSELDDLLEETLGQEKATKEKLDNDDDREKKSRENDEAAAEDMRKPALERVRQTTKRKGKEWETDAEPS